MPYSMLRMFSLKISTSLFSFILFLNVIFIATNSLSTYKNGSASANNLEEIVETLKFEIKPIIPKQVKSEKINNSENSLLTHNLIYFNKRNQRNSEAPSNFVKTVKEYKIFFTEFHRVETPFIIGIWIFFASVAKIGFHMAPKLNRIFPESCLLIVVGVIVGILLFRTKDVQMSPLTPDTFFLYMLPPIILDAGYFMPNRLFFDHLGTILLFAVAGTILNTLSIGISLWFIGRTGFFSCSTPLLDMLLFAALISAVDPVAVLAVFEEIHVDEILYIVVFGESLLNDAVTVVLYHMFETYSEIGPEKIIFSDILSGLASFFVVAIGGTIIGVIWGLSTGFVTRFTDQVRVIEPIFIFVMAYLAYLTAEIFHMSGILAITFCGITMKNYVEANISYKSHTTVKYTMKMLSSSSETIIFMFLGVATVNNKHNWNTGFIITTLLLCSIYRIIGVIVLTAVANHFRLHKLNKVEKFVMSYGGLRGAVAFALVLLIDSEHMPLQPMFVTTTITVIYFTVFFQGITIKPLVKILNVKRAEKKKLTMNERIHEKIMDHIMAGVEDVLGQYGNFHVRDKFKRFDNKFVRPYLVRNYFGAEPKILETYSKLKMKDAFDYIQRNASTIGNINEVGSITTLFKNSYDELNFHQSNVQPYNGWNIDFQELEYNPSRRDLTDAKIHHLLAEELCKPAKRHRRLSYSRHAVDDRDLSTQDNYRIHMNIRRVLGENRHRSKRFKKTARSSKQSWKNVNFSKQSNSDSKEEGTINEDFINLDTKNQLIIKNTEDWCTAISFTAPSIGESIKDFTPTATEIMLPWKREDDDNMVRCILRNELPSWCSTKDYLLNYSPNCKNARNLESDFVQLLLETSYDDAKVFKKITNSLPETLRCKSGSSHQYKRNALEQKNFSDSLLPSFSDSLIDFQYE